MSIGRGAWPQPQRGVPRSTALDGWTSREARIHQQVRTLLRVCTNDGRYNGTRTRTTAYGMLVVKIVMGMISVVEPTATARAHIHCSTAIKTAGRVSEVRHPWRCPDARRLLALARAHAPPLGLASTSRRRWFGAAAWTTTGWIWGQRNGSRCFRRPRGQDSTQRGTSKETIPFAPSLAPPSTTAYSDRCIDHRL